MSDFGWRRETRVSIESMEERQPYIGGSWQGMLAEHENTPVTNLFQLQLGLRRCCICMAADLGPYVTVYGGLYGPSSRDTYARTTRPPISSSHI
jgi:hypothetical protein